MPLATIRRSSALLKDNFAATIVSNIKLALPWVGGMFCALGAALLGGLLVAFGAGEPAVITLGAICLVLGATGFAICAVISSALSTYLQTYLYRYATGADVPGIDPGWLPPRQQV